MAAIVDMSEADEGPGFDVEVEWVGFDKSENTWEALAKIWNASPQFVKSELRKLGLRKAVRAELKKQYGVVLTRVCFGLHLFCRAKAIRQVLVVFFAGNLFTEWFVWSSKGHPTGFGGFLCWQPHRVQFLSNYGRPQYCVDGISLLTTIRVLQFAVPRGLRCVYGALFEPSCGHRILIHGFSSDHTYRRRV